MLSKQIDNNLIFLILDYVDYADILNWKDKNIYIIDRYYEIYKSKLIKENMWLHLNFPFVKDY